MQFLKAVIHSFKIHFILGTFHAHQCQHWVGCTIPQFFMPKVLAPLVFHFWYIATPKS